MKTQTTLLMAICILLFSGIALAEPNDIAGGDVSGIWTEEFSPYRVTGNIRLAGGYTLVIEPGVVMEFDNGIKFDIDGRLLADGTEEMPIVFTSQDPNEQWGGLAFSDSANDDSSITHGRILNAAIGIKITRCTPTIEHCTLTGNTVGIWGDYNAKRNRFEHLNIANNGVGLYAEYMFPSDFESCRIVGNTNAGVAIDPQLGSHASLHFDHCLLYGNMKGIVLKGSRNSLYLNLCTITNSTESELEIYDGVAKISNSIIWGAPFEDGIVMIDNHPNIDASYSNISLFEGVFPGVGNINADPYFANPIDGNDLLSRDYHLKSEAGRWDAVSETWVVDDVTSPCIDAGDPSASTGDEPRQNESRVNMGAYGGTEQASMSLFFYSGGNGTAADPYQISTAQDLIDLGNKMEHYDKHFIMTADIDLSEYTFDRAVIARDFVDGSVRHEDMFRGTFNGNGFSIRKLTILSGNSHLGLFGSINDAASVMNLGMENISIEGHQSSYVGGLIGSNRGNVVNCYSNGRVSGKGGVGGLVGMSNTGTIIRCFSSSIVTGVSSVGGLVGYNGGGRRGRVVDCYSTGAVSGASFVGGLVGQNEHIITNCFSTGLTTGSGAVGGLAGYCPLPGSGNFMVDDCFWDIETSGQSNSPGGTGLTTTEMQDISTYMNANWDFISESENGIDDIWYMPQNDYPRIAPTIMLSGLDSLTATEDDGLIISVEDANATHAFPGTTVFENVPAFPSFAPESADNLDLSTIAICDNQQFVLTQFAQPTKKAVILIRGECDPGRIQLLDQEGLPMSRLAVFDANDLHETGYECLGKPVSGMVVTLNSEFYGIELSALAGETLHLVLVSVVAVLEHIEATEAQLATMPALEVQAQDNAIMTIDGNSVSDLILGTTSFDSPAIWDILFPEAHADDFELDSLANTENQIGVQTFFAQPVTKVFLVVRPAFDSIDSGQIELLDEQGQPLGEPVAFTQADFTSLGHESLRKEAQGMVITGNGYFHGIRIQQDGGLEVSIDLVSVSALPLE